MASSRFAVLAIVFFVISLIILATADAIGQMRDITGCAQHP